LKLAISVGVLFMLLVLGKNSPALIILYGNAQGSGLEPRALATINGLAVVANASVAALSILALVVICRAVWAFWCLAVALLFVDVVRWIGESFFYHQGSLLAEAATLLPTLAGNRLRGDWSVSQGTINRPNHSMKPTAPLRSNFDSFATTPCRGLSLSR
jgi:hypothetical protein